MSMVWLVSDFPSRMLFRPQARLPGAVISPHMRIEFCSAAQRSTVTPAWEYDRRLKIQDNGVYSGEYGCMEISNFQHSATKAPLK
jgi:hypothetical protein